MGLDVVELVLATEKEFELDIPDADAEKIFTPRRLADYVLARAGNAADAKGWTQDYVLQKVIQLTAVQLGIPIEKIHPDDHFVKDLDMC